MHLYIIYIYDQKEPYYFTKYKKYIVCIDIIGRYLLILSVLLFILIHTYKYIYYTVYIIHKYTAILLFTIFRSRLGFIIVRFVCFVWTKTRVGRYYYLVFGYRQQKNHWSATRPLHFSAQCIVLLKVINYYFYFTRILLILLYFYRYYFQTFFILSNTNV